MEVFKVTPVTGEIGKRGMGIGHVMRRDECHGGFIYGNKLN